jgi:hypothetical protein
MSTETITLLSNTSTAGTFTGTKQKGAGYHKYNDGIHTFVISFKNWSGELNLQGSLSLYPGDNDWFDLKDLNDDIITVGDGSSDYDDVYTVSSQGKFVWLRATGTVTAGEITEIRYNY